MKNIHSEKVVCIIQARMGSSRLPGKVMEKICGKPMLQWVLLRTNQATMIDQVLVATTENIKDDPIIEFCQSEGIDFFRGNEFDVLDRYYQAAKQVAADIILRVTADCPLTDPGLVDHIISKLFETGADFCANRLPPPYSRTYPIGLDVEAVRMDALKIAWETARKPYEREHVLPYVYDPANNFKIEVMDHPENLGSLRWTVDTNEDLEFVRAVFQELNCRSDFNWLDVLSILKANPALSEINSEVKHKSLQEVDERGNKKSGING